jgi:hypothetical protein
MTDAQRDRFEELTGSWLDPDVRLTKADATRMLEKLERGKVVTVMTDARTLVSYSTKGPGKASRKVRVSVSHMEDPAVAREFGPVFEVLWEESATTPEEVMKGVHARGSDLPEAVRVEAKGLPRASLVAWLADGASKLSGEVNLDWLFLDEPKWDFVFESPLRVRPVLFNGSPLLIVVLPDDSHEIIRLMSSFKEFATFEEDDEYGQYWKCGKAAPHVSYLADYRVEDPNMYVLSYVEPGDEANAGVVRGAAGFSQYHVYDWMFSAAMGDVPPHHREALVSLEELEDEGDVTIELTTNRRIRSAIKKSIPSPTKAIWPQVADLIREDPDRAYDLDLWRETSELLEDIGREVEGRKNRAWMGAVLLGIEDSPNPAAFAAALEGSSDVDLALEYFESIAVPLVRVQDRVVVYRYAGAEWQTRLTDPPEDFEKMIELVIPGARGVVIVCDGMSVLGGRPRRLAADAPGKNRSPAA